MCNRLINLALECGLKGSKHSVLLALANMANPKNNDQCWPGVQLIGKHAGVSKRAVQGALNFLENAGHITRKMRLNNSTIYTVHPRKDRTPAKVTWEQPPSYGPAKGANNPRNSCGETLRNPKKETDDGHQRFKDSHLFGNLRGPSGSFSAPNEGDCSLGRNSKQKRFRKAMSIGDILKT